MKRTRRDIIKHIYCSLLDLLLLNDETFIPIPGIEKSTYISIYMYEKHDSEFRMVYGITALIDNIHAMDDFIEYYDENILGAAERGEYRFSSSTENELEFSKDSTHKIKIICS